jgi:hypothetical protein
MMDSKRDFLKRKLKSMVKRSSSDAKGGMCGYKKLKAK